MADNRSFPYALADNIVGFDDGYDTLLERGVKAVKKDPMGVAQQLGGALYDSAKGFAGDFVRNPAGTITDSMNNLGLTYVEAGKRLYGGIGSYLDQGMSVEEARDAQLMDSLTLSELGGFGLLANQLRKGLTPNVNITEENPNDPGRRKFLAGAAATVPVAALAPDLITDVATQVAKKGSRAAINPLDIAMGNLKVLKQKIDDQNQILNEMGSIDVDASAGQKVIDSIRTRDAADREIVIAQYEMIDVARDAIEKADPKIFTGASDDAIEEIIGQQYATGRGSHMIIPDHPNYEVIAQEIKRRGMDVATDKNGIGKYPFANVFIDDFFEPIASQAQKNIEKKISSGLLKPDSSMPMVRETPPDIVKEMRQMRIRSAERIYDDKVDELRKLTDFDEEKIQDIAERAKQEELKRMYMGGPVEGIASLNNVARDMYRGPRGIGTYQQFADGGEVVNLNDFNFPPSREDRSQANFASYMGDPDKGPVIEGIESLANVEYEADMQNALSDNVSRLGFDPDVAFTILPGFNPNNIQRTGDHYSPGTDRMGIDPYLGSSATEVQAHEYRHRGLEKVLKHFKKYPFLYKEKYGQESFDFLSKVLEQKRVDLVDRIKGEGRSYPYPENLHENFAEMFEQDFETITGRYHQAEDGRVLVKGIHYGPRKEFETLEDWKEANPGVDLQLRITKTTKEEGRETPDVIKFRDYQVQRDRGELKQKVPKFEAVLQIQDAAGDLIREIKEGKHKELFDKQQFADGGEVNVNLSPLDLPVDGRMSYTQTDDGGMFDSEIRKTFEGGLGSLTPSFDYSTQNRSRNMDDVVIDEDGEQIGFALEGELFLKPESEDKVRGAFEIEKSRNSTNFSLPEGELIETRDGLLKRFNLGMDLGNFGIDLNRTEASGREPINEGSATIRVGENGIIRYSDSNRGEPNIGFNYRKEFADGGAAMSLQVPQGIGSLSETARRMYN